MKVLPKAAASARAEERPDDLALVERAKAGDQQAFALLVERHEAHVLTVARRLLPSREDALDVCQEAFLKAFRGLANFKSDSAFSTWLHRITLNVCASFHRNRMAAKRGTPLSLHQPSRRSSGDGDDFGLEIDGGARQPAEIAHDSDVRMAVAAAIAELDPEFREIVILRDLDGLSYEEISEALGLAAGTVRSRLHRARKELARRLRPFDPARTDEPRADAEPGQNHGGTP